MIVRSYFMGEKSFQVTCHAAAAHQRDEEAKTEEASGLEPMQKKKAAEERKEESKKEKEEDTAMTDVYKTDAEYEEERKASIAAAKKELAQLLDPKLAGGGPLMDVGIYPLNGMRLFSREDPAEFTAMVATRDHASHRFDGMEQTMEFTMKFPSGILASVGTSYGENMPGFLRIHGDKGTIELGPAFDYTGIHLRSLDPHVQADATSPDEQTFHFQLEAAHFAECIRTGATPKTPGEEGLKDMLAIEAIYRAAGHPIA